MLIDWFTVCAQALNFLILVWLMKRFLYKPILDAIDAREKKVAAELADANTKKTEAQKDRDDFQHKNEEFDRQRAALMTKATGPQHGEEGPPVLDGWTWHDFRRSFTTALGEASVPEAVADAVLNHRQSATRGGVLGVYQRASRWPEQVKAMELWGRLLALAIEGCDGVAKVVPMTARAG